MKITIRLRPGKDDGIHKWYDSLERGERSRVIRGILKEHINHNKEKADFIFDTGRQKIDLDKADLEKVEKSKTNNTQGKNVNQKVKDLLDNL